MKDTPYVTLCTPTFNRRPFIPYMIKCIEQQTYPQDKIEWIIVDDGTDKIEDLIKDIPYVKYFKYENKMTLGEKRNIIHTKVSHDIIIYIDDDDYYPPERISHAVDTLQKNPDALCCGSSEMHIYFKHINEMYQCGPYAPKHATAATFAFRRKLLEDSSYESFAALGEEKAFLKNYTVPLVQLDTQKTILVFSHIHNSFDKKDLLKNENKYVKKSRFKVEDFIKDKEISDFFLKDIDHILEAYKPGDPKNKKDVETYMNITRRAREESMEHMKRLQQDMQNQANVQFASIQKAHNEKIEELVRANKKLKEEKEHVTKKITDLIQELVQLKTKLKNYEQNEKKE